MAACVVEAAGVVAQAAGVPRLLCRPRGRPAGVPCLSYIHSASTASRLVMSVSGNPAMVTEEERGRGRPALPAPQLWLTWRQAELLSITASDMLDSNTPADQQVLEDKRGSCGSRESGKGCWGGGSNNDNWLEGCGRGIRRIMSGHIGRNGTSWNMIIERRISGSGSKSSGSSGSSGSRSSGISGRSAGRLGRRLRMACSLQLLQRDPVAESAEHGRREQPLPPLPPDV